MTDEPDYVSLDEFRARTAGRWAVGDVSRLIAQTPWPVATEAEAEAEAFVTTLEGQSVAEARDAWERMTAGLERLPPVVLPSDVWSR